MLFSASFFNQLISNKGSESNFNFRFNFRKHKIIGINEIPDVADK